MKLGLIVWYCSSIFSKPLRRSYKIGLANNLVVWVFGIVKMQQTKLGLFKVGETRHLLYESVSTIVSVAAVSLNSSLLL